MHRVLIIDDDAKMRELVADILRMYKFQPLCAATAEEGLQAAVLHRPNLVLCDVILPDSDGIETAKAMKASPTTTDTPVVLMTGYPYMQRYNTGQWKLLLKPFSLKELMDTVRVSLKLAA
jgi:two-component system, OmpR family, phosphate regulon response regulator PhoB